MGIVASPVRRGGLAKHPALAIGDRPTSAGEISGLSACARPRPGGRVQAGPGAGVERVRRRLSIGAVCGRARDSPRRSPRPRPRRLFVCRPLRAGDARGSARSLLQYFDGRSSLATWLHAVLARRFVDNYRQERRTGSIEDCPPGALPEAGSAADPPDPDRIRYLEMLRAALDVALRSLKPRDRLRLSCYYLESLTLKQVGEVLGEHESSVSRRLSRTRKALRRQVERALRREQRLSDEQIRLCYDYAMQEWPFDLTQALSQSDRS